MPGPPHEAGLAAVPQVPRRKVAGDRRVDGLVVHGVHVGHVRDEGQRVEDGQDVAGGEHDKDHEVAARAEDERAAEQAQRAAWNNTSSGSSRKNLLMDSIHGGKYEILNNDPFLITKAIT